MKKNLLVLFIVLLLPGSAFAQEADIVNPDDVAGRVTNAYQQVAPEAKNIFGRVYNWLETFRVNTAEKLDAMWMAKAEEASRLQDEQNQAVEDHAEAVISGESTTLVRGASGRARWGIIGAKVAKAGLSVLVFVFETQAVFYGAIIVIVLYILYAIFQKFRDWRREKQLYS